MKHSKLIVVAAVAVSAMLGIGAVSAADLPVKALPYTAAPVPFSWTGFYVGGLIGWGWGTKEWSNACDAVGNVGCYSPPLVTSGTASGFLGGLQAGYNYQIDRLVLGIEGDFSWADVSGNSPCFGGVSTCSSKADWFGTLAGRIGGTVDHALLYVKGGAAWVHDKYTENCPACSANGGPITWDGSHTKAGWMVGAGIEYAFTRNWSAKVEYDYMDFGTTSVRMTDLPVPPPAPVPVNFVSAVTAYNVNILQHVNVVKAGVNYRF
jgi:outer membrane immunogenic protein